MTRLMLSCTTCLLVLSSPLAAREWQVQLPTSRLGFSGVAQEEPFKGEFKRYDAQISIDPAKPEATRISVEIEIASVDTRNDERDSTLATPDFFWRDKFPKARFRTLACRAGASPGAIDCEAELTLRDRTHKLAFPFTFKVEGERASLASKVVLDRLAFDVGGGSWADEGTIAKAVEVQVQLDLK